MFKKGDIVTVEATVTDLCAWGNCHVILEVDGERVPGLISPKRAGIKLKGNALPPKPTPGTVVKARNGSRYLITNTDDVYYVDIANNQPFVSGDYTWPSLARAGFTVIG